MKDSRFFIIEVSMADKIKIAFDHGEVEITLPTGEQKELQLGNISWYNEASISEIREKWVAYIDNWFENNSNKATVLIQLSKSFLMVYQTLKYITEDEKYEKQ